MKLPLVAVVADWPKNHVACTATQQGSREKLTRPGAIMHESQLTRTNGNFPLKPPGTLTALGESIA